MRADSGWTSPFLNDGAEEQFRTAYAENCENFTEILENSPYEIAVLARLLAYLQTIVEVR
ncbi:MAG: hypothetical protein IKI37_03445 [Oscillospiraceae bacterium]|nr:hypothetical protein [Oscillospiraceae bacterium]MBR7084216.1 hypothetical protein [Oscillospiraceae bacterium]